MASKRDGTKAIEYWKHLRHRKRAQARKSRELGKRQCRAVGAAQ